MDFEVRRDDLRTTRVEESSPPELHDGEALLRVDHFALTANNVTYAVMGDAMSYWQFFPAPEAGWGRVPVWGYADVEASEVPGLTEGQRVYGYLPMSTHLVVTPGRVGDHSFVDASTHRASLPPVYNQYLLVDGDDRSREAATALLRPLFATAFLIDDWLTEDDATPPEQIVLASASSKTALGLAYLLHERGAASVVGLTSPGNAGFVESVGYCDCTVTYDHIDGVPVDVPTAFVDMAGDGRVLGAVHHHLGDSLRTSCLVGATHWEQGGAPADLPGPAPSFFFAPDRVEKRRADWGPGGLDSRLSAAFDRFLASVDGWLEIVERRGPDEMGATWLEVLEGKAPPQRGYVVSPSS